MLSILSGLLSPILDFCYGLLGNWWAAILLFTAITKVILMPLSLWCQRNSITMVELMPDLFRIKIRYFGDREAIDEKQNELYHERHYNALLSMVPLAIQIVILMGLSQVIHGITDSGAPGTELLGQVPIEDGGIAWIMPPLATLSAVVMGVAANLINPLQREQTKTEQNVTNGISIALSLFLAVFVVCGMAFYWVCSNLLSVLVQVACNIIINPKRYIDYDDLNAARDKYEALQSETANKTGAWWKPDPIARRAKADFKRFFRADGKHIVFYSEGSGFYKYFRGAIEWLLSNSDAIIHYVTSDPNDQVFAIHESEPRLIPYFVDQRRLITLMMKIDSDVVVTTLGDLDVFYIKRSRVRSDIEYVYMCHHMTSMPLTSHKTEYCNYDTVMCVGPHQAAELRAMAEVWGARKQSLPAIGYDLLDREIEDYRAMDHTPNAKTTVLIAPTWNLDNILDSCIDDLLGVLLGRGWKVILRPHPEYIKRFTHRWEDLVSRYAHVPKDELVIEDDFSGHSSILSADVLVTDWSSISCEFSFTTLKPCIFIDTTMKVNNPDWEQIPLPPTDITIRTKIGRSFDPNDLSGIPEAVTDMVVNAHDWEDRISAVRDEMIYNLGRGGEAAGEYLLDRMLQIQEGRRAEA